MHFSHRKPEVHQQWLFRLCMRQPIVFQRAQEPIKTLPMGAVLQVTAWVPCKVLGCIPGPFVHLWSVSFCSHLVSPGWGIRIPILYHYIMYITYLLYYIYYLYHLYHQNFRVLREMHQAWNGRIFLRDSALVRLVPPRRFDINIYWYIGSIIDCPGLCLDTFNEA